MAPSNQSSHTDRGYIVPIGGAEEKLNNPEILDRFVDICGGKTARIAIIPTASELEDTGRNYEKLFRKLGIRHAQVLEILTREDCNSEKFLGYIEKAQGVFMTGGNTAVDHPRWHRSRAADPSTQCRRNARCRHFRRRRIHAGTHDCGWRRGQHPKSR